MDKNNRVNIQHSFKGIYILWVLFLLIVNISLNVKYWYVIDVRQEIFL